MIIRYEETEARAESGASPVVSRDVRFVLTDNLNPILGFSQLLAENPHLNPEERRQAANIYAAAGRILRVTRATDFGPEAIEERRA